MNSDWQKSTLLRWREQIIWWCRCSNIKGERDIVQVSAEAENKVNFQGRRARCMTLAWLQPSLAQCTRLFYCTLRSTITLLSCCCIRVSKLNSPSCFKPCFTVSFYVCLGCLPCGLKEVQACEAVHECRPTADHRKGVEKNTVRKTKAHLKFL